MLRIILYFENKSEGQGWLAQRNNTRFENWIFDRISFNSAVRQDFLHAKVCTFTIKPLVHMRDFDS